MAGLVSDNGAMNTDAKPRSLKEAWAAWVHEALDYAASRGLTLGKVAEQMTTVDRAGLSKMRYGGRGVSGPEVTELSRATGFQPPVDLVVANVEIMTDFIPQRPGVATGIWREESNTVSVSPLRVREFLDPVYSGLKQDARLIEDNHADLYANKGFYVICVDYHDARTAPNDGDIVVIERLRPFDGSNLIETSIREVARRDGKLFLNSLSSTRSDSIPYNGDTETLRISALVLAAYKPSPRT